MKIVLLDGNVISCADDLHRAFSEALGFPEYYGANLDALNDMLSERAGETGVIAVNTAGLKKAMGRKWKPFLRLMDDLSGNGTGFCFTADPFGTGKND